MPLDSDFQNADNHLQVEFYNYDGPEQQHKGQTFVRIIVPGDKYNIIDTPAAEHHKQRFPRQWLYFQMKTNEIPLAGISLAEWRQDRPEDISENQLAELSIFKFQVVEQLATASDAQLQRVGMGGIALRQKAQDYIRGRHASAASGELDQTKKELAELKAQMAQLLAAQSEKRGPGRPPKEA
jgi:hypothetical protein